MKEELPERYFYQKNTSIRIGHILKDLYPGKNATKHAYQKLKNAWRTIVGDEIFQCTEITGIKNRVLYVTVESTTMIHYLTNFEKSAIIVRFNEIVDTVRIDDIRFTVGNAR
ncbi:MAG: DUF721 domain-containing protein [Candidatus Brocadiaceae bacterium]|nr:DUF721 domain-containing protein [Candidatus Brocadiaceae bacterium]